ncbi:hypothetical protein L7F22_019061 [Adiantum nelumboides]|nr:hypothetical protein [Adiantum nelumboides]
MPGIKRKSKGTESSHASGSKPSSSSTKRERKEPTPPSPEDSENDDFDDGEDLMAAALNGEAVSEGESELEEDSEDVNMYSDEDMEGGFVEVGEDEEEDVTTGGSTSTRPNGKQKSLYAIPSRDEMSQLKNTTELFKSNIFRLKVEEMLSEVRPKYEKSNALDFVLRHIKSRLESLVEIEPASLSEATKKLSKLYKAKVNIPFPDPAPKADSPLKFAFEKPSKVQVAGSWVLKSAALRPEGVDVDLVLTMPSQLFQEKDHMNMRYFYKRAFYLATIAAALSTDESLKIDVSFASTEEDIRRPYLLIKSKRDGSQSDFSKTKANIKIHLAHEHDLFAPARLAPSRNGIRVEKDAEEQPATPHYNSAILADQLYIQHLVYLNETMSACKEFGNASILLKTWAMQRSLGSGPSKAELKGKASAEQGRRVAFGSTSIRFILTMILAHLLNGPDKTQHASSSASVSRLSQGFSSYQLFKGVIDFLAHHDFKSHPVFMKGSDEIISRRDKIPGEDFLNQFSHILVDPTGSINLLANMSEGSIGYLQREAKATFDLLNNADQDRFEEVFLLDRSKPSFVFDDVMNVTLDGYKATAKDKADLGSPLSCAIQYLSKTLAKGLTNRHTMTTVFGANVQSWSLSSTRITETTVEVGINLDTSQAFRLVDHGPRPEETQAAEEFKAFWGDLSELRRFRDGRIVESVVWNVKGQAQKLSIPRRIAQYVIQKHVGAKVKDEDFHSTAFENLCSPEESLAAKAYLNSPIEQGFQPAITAFDQLAKQLRELKDLPLSLISVVPTDAGLRSTSVMIPGAANVHGHPSMSASYLPTMDFVMTFESSGQWPDDLPAIQAMKMAFFESISSKLIEILPGGSRVNVVLDHDADDNKLWDKAALEVILASGFAYRGRIHHIREETLLERIIDDKDESSFMQSQAKSALERYHNRFTNAIRHHNHMSALVSRFPSMSDAIRLMKRWINGQLFGNQLAEELIELLVVSVYIEASSAPGLGHLGFLQTLRKLADWNWQETPLVVPMTASTSATPSSIMEMSIARSIQANFGQLRRMDSSMHHLAWFIATEEEPKGVRWARNSPSAGSADALQRLAKAACTLLESGSFLPFKNVKASFVPDLSHFDFVIELEPAAVTRYIDSLCFDAKLLNASEQRSKQGQKTASLYRNFADLNNNSQKGDKFLANFDSGSEFVHLIETLYLDNLRLYYDSFGGCSIGGMFNPTLIQKQRAFRVGLGFNSIPASVISESGSAKEVILNQNAIVEEIQRIGKGIVQKVTLRNSTL